MLLSGVLEQHYEIDVKDSWMFAAAQKNLPIVVGGWEDSTMGNIFASYVIKNELKASTMKSGIEYMVWLADWYKKNSGGKGVGFFQIGGGIAGDFPICWRGDPGPANTVSMCNRRARRPHPSDRPAGKRRSY